MTKIDYNETTNDLLARIDIHKKYGSRDIDQWMNHMLDPQKGSKILDVGCGAGKQCFLFYKTLEGEADITGGDMNAELLQRARKENDKIGNRIKFIDLDFNQVFPLPDNEYDLVTSCFAIYYAEDIPFTISEMHRVIKPGGRLFTTGPMPENKRLFYDIIFEATQKPIPPMPGSSRYSSQIFNAIQERFSKVELNIFENPLVFDAVQPFIEYTRASLAEDRLLWRSLFEEAGGFGHVMENIKSVAERRLAREGKLVMTKVVGGFIATK
jgi:ubiquinone/menaquinone biosynthesis C-methylase UbiE